MAITLSSRIRVFWVVALILIPSICLSQDPPAEAKPSDSNSAEKQDDAAADEEKGEPEIDEKEAKPILRADIDPEDADPDELTQEPGEDGRIQFQFRNQPWPDFLRWLSRVGKYSIDWQQMPGDFINISTEKRYTIEQARDLVNRLLMERGYTTVLQGQVLIVAKIDKLDPSLLPRLDDESELLDHAPHDFAKITFKLPNKLKADSLAEDIKGLLSPHATVQPLMATNRLLVIDAVVNLRDASRLINQEHAAAAGHQVPREFLIQHVAADYVADQVMILLGLDPSSRRSPSELQVEQQKIQLFMQMQQKGTDVSKYLRSDDGPRVYIAVNKRINSLLVNAEKDEMEQIERAIEKLDVSSSYSAVQVPGQHSAAVSMQTKKYRLTTLKPESVVSALKEIAGLDPRTHLYMDSDAKVIFASATLRDHEQISALIDKLDGSDRTTHVIWLKRLPADQVAITIKNLLVGAKEPEKQSRNFFYYSYRNEEPEEDKTQLRVEADISNNRLLLFANEDEIAQVRNLLVQMGELPGDGLTSNPNTVRVLDRRSRLETTRMLEQLKQIWPLENPLRIDLPKAEDPESIEETVPDSNDEETPTITQHSGSVDSNVTSPTTLMVNRSMLKFFQQPTQNDLAKKAEISISVSEDGRLIITSLDTTALDTLEELLVRIAPPPKNYKVYHLRHALASLVTLNLEEYFEGESTFDTDENWMRAYYGFDFKAEDNNNGLASRRSVRFIYDIDTNSILVRDATPEQLETIDELIEIYDQAPAEDSISARRIAIYRLKYSDANMVASTVKEVFRDLLSSKDKAFAGQSKDEKKESSISGVYRFFGPSTSDEKEKPTKVKASFQGALSVGVDSISNSVIVSAQEEWMPSIEQMIEFMDQNAMPNTSMVVAQTSAGTNAEFMRKLADVMRPWPGNKRPKPAPSKPQEKPEASAENAAPQNPPADQVTEKNDSD